MNKQKSSFLKAKACKLTAFFFLIQMRNKSEGKINGVKTLKSTVLENNKM